MNPIDKKIEQLTKKEKKMNDKLQKMNEDLDKIKKEREDFIKDKLYKTFEKMEISLSEYLELIEMSNDDIIEADLEKDKNKVEENELSNDQNNSLDYYSKYSENDM